MPPPAFRFAFEVLVRRARQPDRALAGLAGEIRKDQRDGKRQVEGTEQGLAQIGIDLREFLVTRLLAHVRVGPEALHRPRLRPIGQHAIGCLRR